MKLPESIKVAAQKYDIVSEDESWYWKTGYRGVCNHDDGIIRIAEILDNQRKKTTLIHEIFHAIFYEYNLQDGDKEERIVTTFATGWAQVLQDNPELRKALSIK